MGLNSIDFCPYRSLGKNVRELTHQSVVVVTIHASVRQCQSFLKLSLYIPFLKKYFSLYNLYVELWELGIPCFNGSSWKSVWKRIKILVKILRQRARSPRAKHYFWIWRPLEDEIVNTLVNIAKYIIFLLVIEFVNFDFDFEDGSERNKSYWIGW